MLVSERSSLRLVVSGRLGGPLTVLQMDNRIPRLRFTRKGLLLIGIALRVSGGRTWKTYPPAECLGNVSSVEAKPMLQ